MTDTAVNDDRVPLASLKASTYGTPVTVPQADVRPSVSTLINEFNHSTSAPGEFLARYLDRRDLVGPLLNCLIWSPPKESIMQVQSRTQRNLILRTLSGIPFVIKDCLHVAGMPTTGGMSHTMIDHVTPERDAPVVDALKKAGAVCIAKANLPDLHLGLSSDSSSFGRVKFPYRMALNAIGSSGGVAAAVAAGIAPFGIGTDTGGCLRIPSALCGVCGFRPSFERYDNSGMLHQSITRDTPGPIARTIEDIQVLDKILSTTCPRKQSEPGLLARGIEKLTGKMPIGSRIYPSEFHAASLSDIRIGICRDYYFHDLHSDVASAMEHLISKLKAAGVSIVECSFLSGNEPWTIDASVGEPIRGYEILREVSRYLYENKCTTSVRNIVEKFPGTKRDKDMLEAALSGDVQNGCIPVHKYRDALMIHRARLQESFDDFFRRYRVDVIMYPTTPLPVSELNEDGTVTLNGKNLPTYPTYTRFTAPSSNAGLPCVSFPCGMTPDGLPVGVELAGPRSQDSRVLEIARAVFESLPVLPVPNIDLAADTSLKSQH